MSRKRFAAIDIGTVTCRLLIADVDGGHLDQLYRETAIVNLGEGVDASGVLLDAAMQRVDAQVASYLEKIKEYGAECPVEIIANATSASRDAKNSKTFVDMLARRGVQLSVIPGTKEASLSFLGASADYPGQRLLVADIGGGSTELIAGVGGQEPVLEHSFNVGCRRVTERFLQSDPPLPREMRAAMWWFDPQFAKFFARLRQNRFDIQRIVAVAGTATSVVSIDEAMEVYDSARVHGTVVSDQTLRSVSNRLSAMTLEQRRQVVGLQPDRAPVIVAGMLILQNILQHADKQTFTVSESDILQGMIMDAAR